MTDSERWYGLLPEGWRELRVGWLVDLVNGYPFDASLFSDVGYPLVRIRDLGRSQSEVRYAGEFVDTAAIHPGDVLIGMDGDFNVGRWIGELPALLNQRVCLLRGDDYVTRYLEYALPFPLMRINDLTYATTVKHLSSGQVLRTWIPLPPEDDRLRQIVDFLDRQTAQIDAMVDAQERLVGLLQERRRAITKVAVVGGLSPIIDRSPSGISWLGDVPSHWSVLPLRRCAKLTTGITPPTEEEDNYIDGDDGYPWVRPEDLDPSGRATRASKRLSAAGWRVVRSVSPGSTLVCCIGATLGKVGIVDETVATNQQITAVTSDLDHRFVFHALSASYEGLRLSSVGNTLPILNNDKLGALPFPLPPMEEQRAISAYLDEAVGRIDAMAAKARESIVLMKERRVALISAAVTGRIDVRTGVERAERDLEEVKA